MNEIAEHLLNQALNLPEEDRAEFAERLWHSVPGWDGQSSESELTDEQKAMLDRRWEEIVSGKVECRPIKEVISEMRVKYGG